MKLLLYILACAGTIVAHGALVSVEIKVVDADTGKPLPDMEVGAAFSNPPRFWGDLSRDGEKVGRTGKDGCCRFVGTTSSGEVGFSAGDEKGYYQSEGSVDIHLDENPISGRIVPHHRTATLRLYKIGNPIPLIVKEEYLGRQDDLFGENNVLQYDLLKSDWLPPVGNGEVADLEFRRIPKVDLGEGVSLMGRKGRRWRHEMEVRFPGKDNGYVEVQPFTNSWIKLRSAPEGGYSSTPDKRWWQKDESLKEMTNHDDNRCICFRIRSKRDENGVLTEAYYGKMYEDYDITYTLETCEIGSPRFFYYLNPNSLDRNLEFDGKHNLCTHGRTCRALHP